MLQKLENGNCLADKSVFKLQREANAYYQLGNVGLTSAMLLSLAYT